MSLLDQIARLAGYDPPEHDDPDHAWADDPIDLSWRAAAPGYHAGLRGPAPPLVLLRTPDDREAAALRADWRAAMIEWQRTGGRPVILGQAPAPRLRPRARWPWLDQLAGAGSRLGALLARAWSDIRYGLRL